ncbi:Pseudouridine-5'-monophosphatase [Phytophthora nicotianae]|uniref:Pseudouridine-5'-monophosphatase n=1 Tax=Phytophthora nicotianae TaxID=4792 RepID=A0A0W8CWS1_PHYNI|nr:Pseudouridine-5'-monophosphatase [Phytophthora nicotianae]
MARTHKTAHIKAAMAEKERLAKESRRDDIARVQDARTRFERAQALKTVQRSHPRGYRRWKREKSTENTSEERPGDAEAQEDEDENVAESTGVEAKNGSYSADVSEEDVAQTPVAEEPSGRQRQGKGPF